MKQKARIKLPLVESYYRDNPVILVVCVVMHIHPTNLVLAGRIPI